jgi:hypothetical protein
VALASNAGAFFFFVFVMFCTLLAAQSLVLLISAIVPNFGAGNGFGSGLFGRTGATLLYCLLSRFAALFFLFAGFFIARSNIPGWWIWFHWLSIFKYPLEAATQNQFQHTGAYNVCDDGVPNSAPRNNCMLAGGALMDNLRIAHDINKWILMVTMLRSRSFSLSLTCLPRLSFSDSRCSIGCYSTSSYCYSSLLSGASNNGISYAKSSVALHV